MEPTARRLGLAARTAAGMARRREGLMRLGLPETVADGTSIVPGRTGDRLRRCRPFPTMRGAEETDLALCQDLHTDPYYAPSDSVAMSRSSTKRTNG